jgi:hypothetical protein
MTDTNAADGQGEDGEAGGDAEIDVNAEEARQADEGR